MNDAEARKIVDRFLNYARHLWTKHPLFDWPAPETLRVKGEHFYLADLNEAIHKQTAPGHASGHPIILGRDHHGPLLGHYNLPWGTLELVPAGPEETPPTGEEPQNPPLWLTLRPVETYVLHGVNTDVNVPLVMDPSFDCDLPMYRVRCKTAGMSDAGAWETRYIAAGYRTASRTILSSTLSKTALLPCQD